MAEITTYAIFEIIRGKKAVLCGECPSKDEAIKHAAAMASELGGTYLVEFQRYRSFKCQKPITQVVVWQSE